MYFPPPMSQSKSLKRDRVNGLLVAFESSQQRSDFNYWVQQAIATNVKKVRKFYAESEKLRVAVVELPSNIQTGDHRYREVIANGNSSFTDSAR